MADFRQIEEGVYIDIEEVESIVDETRSKSQRQCTIRMKSGNAIASVLPPETVLQMVSLNDRQREDTAEKSLKILEEMTTQTP